MKIEKLTKAQSSSNKEKQMWNVFKEENGVVHVIPNFDSRPHGFPKNGKAELEDVLCPCKPEIKRENEVTIIIHNSFMEEDRLNEALKISRK